MFAIGDFAKHARVSVRMLRHYDALGLLPPARVDEFSGYRYYDAAQLARVNRIVALKDLGFTLRQVQSILDAEVDAEELRGMLRLRRAELENAAAAAAARLAQVEVRLAAIEQEGRIPGYDVVVKSLAPMRLAEVSDVAPGFDPGDVGPVIGPCYEALCRRLQSVGVTPTGPGLAYYEEAASGDGAIVVHAGLPVAAHVHGDDGFGVVELPSVARAATVVHHGPMDNVLPAVQSLARWVDVNDCKPVGLPRELSVHCPEDHCEWVTELQQPVAAA